MSVTAFVTISFLSDSDNNNLGSWGIKLIIRTDNYSTSQFLNENPQFQTFKEMWDLSHSVRQNIGHGVARQEM